MRDPQPAIGMTIVYFALIDPCQQYLIANLLAETFTLLFYTAQALRSMVL
jgi:hypothetical protein